MPFLTWSALPGAPTGKMCAASTSRSCTRVTAQRLPYAKRTRSVTSQGATFSHRSEYALAASVIVVSSLLGASISFQNAPHQ